jgi:hypothetical protein
MKVDVSAICRKALAEATAGAALDGALERACRDLYTEAGQDVCEAVQQMVTHCANQRSLSRPDAARELADSVATLDVITHTVSGAPPPEMAAEMLKLAQDGKPHIQSRVVRHVWTSDDGTPPPEGLLKLLEQGAGKRRRVETVVMLPGGIRVRGWVALLAALAIALGVGLLMVWSALR